MEEEMRKIEEEFAFQEKWIEIFKRGKFFFQNIPEHLILKIITKMEAKVFFNILRTGKWMHILCRENRDSLIIPLDMPYFLSLIINLENSPCFVYLQGNFSSKKTKQRVGKYFQLMEKLIRSKYYFHLYGLTFGSDLLAMIKFYSKNSYYFNRRYWTIEVLASHVTSMNKELVQSLQPEIIYLLDRNQNGPMAEHFSVPTITKHLIVESKAVTVSDFYNEIKQFGPLNCMITLNKKGRFEFKELLSIMKEVTKKRHLNHPLLEFLTFSREKYNEYRIFESWPELYDLPINDLSTQLFYIIIVTRSEIAVTVSYLLRIVRDEQEHFIIEFERVVSSQEWEAYMNNEERFEDSFILSPSYAHEEFEKQKVAFTKQVSSRFFQGGRAIYPPLAPPEPAREFVEFLKEFEDFDIQPEKLAPHKPKWKKTEKLPDLPRKLPEIHSNNWLIEAKEVIKLRKFWMDFLQKGKFILELMPLKNVLDIVKKMHFKQFPLFFSTTKWVKNLIERSTPRLRVHGGKCSINRCWEDELPQLKEFLAALEYFYLEEIRFLVLLAYCEREIGLDRVRKMLAVFKEREIYARTIDLYTDCPLIEDFFEFTAKRPERLIIGRYTTLHEPIEFPPELKEIRVEYDACLALFDLSYLPKIIDIVSGIEQQVNLRASDEQMASKAIIKCIEQLKIKKCKSNVSITNMPYDYKYDYKFIKGSDRHFDLSQISETVFIFRSMARGRGGVWNYFIRLEKAESGAVGIAYYLDSIQNEDDELHQFAIRCEYFPTMERFLDYFEREIGSKRRARDWMQLREKDKTIEPREEDFKEFKKLTPFIHFNEQKETDDFKEIRRRFFS